MIYIGNEGENISRKSYRLFDVVNVRRRLSGVTGSSECGGGGGCDVRERDRGRYGSCGRLVEG